MPTKIPIRNLDEKYAAIFREECHSGDTEADHAFADELLCDLLIELGAMRTVAEWRKVKKWYA